MRIEALGSTLNKNRVLLVVLSFRTRARPTPIEFQSLGFIFVPSAASLLTNMSAFERPSHRQSSFSSPARDSIKDVWGSVDSSVSLVATDSVSVKPGEVALDDIAELAAEPPPRCDTAPRKPGAGDDGCGPKLNPSLGGSDDVESVPEVPNRLPKGFCVEDELFAAGDAVVNLKDGADVSEAPKVMGAPCFQVLSVPGGEARTDRERGLLSIALSPLLGVLGLDPNMPSPGIGPFLVSPPAKIEAPRVGARDAAGGAVKLKVVAGL